MYLFFNTLLYVRLVATITSISWSDYIGDLKGFSSTNPPPPIAKPAGIVNAMDTSGDVHVTEATTMTGTDESV
jgi:hypothetical protein